MFLKISWGQLPGCPSGCGPGLVLFRLFSTNQSSFALQYSPFSEKWLPWDLLFTLVTDHMVCLLNENTLENPTLLMGLNIISQHFVLRGPDDF